MLPIIDGAYLAVRLPKEVAIISDVHHQTDVAQSFVQLKRIRSVIQSDSFSFMLLFAPLYLNMGLALRLIAIDSVSRICMCCMYKLGHSRAGKANMHLLGLYRAAASSILNNYCQ